MYVMGGGVGKPHADIYGEIGPIATPGRGYTAPLKIVRGIIYFVYGEKFAHFPVYLFSSLTYY